MTPAEQDRASLLCQTRRAINKAPGVMANRLRELQRKLAHDLLTDAERAKAERALENLQAAFAVAQRCTDCGRPITTDHAKDIGLGSKCERKAVA
jgi:predicted membrane chloride channel (bestrophin family)